MVRPSHGPPSADRGRPPAPSRSRSRWTTAATRSPSGRRHGELYARDLPASGVEHRSQRLGPAGRRTARGGAAERRQPRDRPVDRQRPGRGPACILDYSAPGVRFGPPRLIESFADPDGLRSPAGSPQLVRLSSESVMAAWDGRRRRDIGSCAPRRSTSGACRPSRRSPPSAGDALLSALAPGPRQRGRRCCGPSRSSIASGQPRSEPPGA